MVMMMMIINQTNCHEQQGFCTERNMSGRGVGGTNLDDPRERATRRLEDVLQVLAAGGRLVADAALHEVACGIARDLAGDEDRPAGLDGLRLHMKPDDVSQETMLCSYVRRRAITRASWFHERSEVGLVRGWAWSLSQGENDWSKHLPQIFGAWCSDA
jgi:hypothetical protein